MRQSIVARLFDAINAVTDQGHKVQRIVLYGDAWGDLHGDPTAVKFIDYTLHKQPYLFAGIPLASEKSKGDGIEFRLESKQ